MIIAFLLIFSVQVFSSFGDGLHFSTMMGCSYSGKSPLNISLNDQPNQSFTANYDNRCFDDSHWWSFRLENWSNKTSFGFEIIHHKIYLINTNEVIEKMSVSDGYNLLFLNFGRQLNDMNFRVGFGLVYGHMDISIIGRDRYIKKGLSGHYLTGPAFQINIEKLIWESESHFISLDSKFTAAYAEIPVSSDYNELAHISDYAIHLSIAVGSKPNILSNKKINNLNYFLPFVYPAIVGNLILGTGILPGE